MFPVSQTILQQLGGNRFIAMTGADQFKSSENSLAFRLRARNKLSCNWVTVVLEASDTYIVLFSRIAVRKDASGIRRPQLTTKKIIEGLYCDQLQDIFTRETGLYTHL